MTQKGGAFSPRGTSTMTACRHFMAICFGLAAWFWCTAGAFAQERPASAQPEGAGSRAGVVAPSDFPWDTVEWVERRYKIEAMHFKARDETGIDWWGDDDVMIETVDAKGWTVSDEIGDVDSGETHPRPPSTRLRVASSPCAPASSCWARRRCATTSANPRPCGLRSSSGRRTSKSSLTTRPVSATQ